MNIRVAITSLIISQQKNTAYMLVQMKIRQKMTAENEAEDQVVAF